MSHTRLNVDGTAESPADKGKSDASAALADRLAYGLGWLSLGLGFPQLVSPGTVTRISGVGNGPKQRGVTAAVGARELVHAAGLFSRRWRPGWVWTRVAGDAMDLTALGVALGRRDGRGVRRTATATALIGGITAVDVYTALQSRKANSKDGGMELTKTTTVTREPQEVYEFWRGLRVLPAFMAHVHDVRVVDERTVHWRAESPRGVDVEWDAQIVDDVPGRSIGWKSEDPNAFPHSGSVSFRAAPGGRGTEVAVTVGYTLPGGKVGEAVGRFFGNNPSQQLDDDVRRFKQVLETGEVVRSDGAPWGKQARKEFPQRPAQPLSDDELAELVKEGSL